MICETAIFPTTVTYINTLSSFFYLSKFKYHGCTQKNTSNLLLMPLFSFYFLMIPLESNNGSGRRKAEEETTGRREEKIGGTRGRTAPSTRKRTDAETV